MLNPFGKGVKARLKILALQFAIVARYYAMAFVGIKAGKKLTVTNRNGILCLISVIINCIGGCYIGNFGLNMTDTLNSINNAGTLVF